MMEAVLRCKRRQLEITEGIDEETRDKIKQLEEKFANEYKENVIKHLIGKFPGIDVKIETEHE